MISYYPKDIFESLEFDKIINLLREATLSSEAERVVMQLEGRTDLDVIQRMLDETEQYKKTVEDGNELPMSGFSSVKEDVPLLKKENYVLSVEGIQRIYKIIALAKALKEYFTNPTYQKQYVILNEIVARIAIDASLLREIDRVLDDQGEVKPDASEELLRIHKEIRSKERELDRVFNAARKNAAQRGFLSDTAESMRNGRRVLTIAAEHKRKLQGVIHDESATGKNVYIEPASVMPINNQIFNLYTERKKEIYKVLRELCHRLRPYADHFLIIEDVLVHLDIIRAKSRLALMMDAHKPHLLDRPIMGLKQAYNPVLLLKNKEVNKPTIPFDLTLHGANRIIIISGPNAGGKSITMKSVGLLQLMIQYGLLIPAHEDSKVGIFKKVFADIGDQQSVEDDLSTYSGRLKNMKHFIDHADEETLIIIDEFGSGTDPKIGGSIAEAILRQLNFKKCYGVITTHYSNLKYYAFKTKGLLNGSMEFDNVQLNPTYQLIVGKPGSSFAFEIAEKIGLSKKLLSYARHKTGKNEKAIDELLTNLQSEKKEVEDKLALIMGKEDKLDKMINAYEELHRELEFRRKKLKLEKKEQKLVDTSKKSRELDELIKELRKEKDLQKAIEKAEMAKASNNHVREEISSLSNELYEKQLGDIGEIEVGDHVKMLNGEASGEVITIDKKNAIVQMGILKLTVPLHNLKKIGDPVKTFKKSIHTNLRSDRERFETKIDIRGYKKSDAEQYVQEFLDRAIINNASQLKIIHGIGNGVLSKVVRKKLKEYADVKNVSHPEEEYGGAGVTIVDLD